MKFLSIRLFHGVIWLSSVGASGVAAQAPNAPLPPGKPENAIAADGKALPQGQGAGVHSPESPFPPLPQRSDVVAWSTLTEITTKIENKRIVPVYAAPVAALNQKKLRLQGFMMPLEAGELQSRFLLSSVPLTCSFCTPGGPESMVEVQTSKPVKYKLEAVVVEGTFHVLKSDPSGLYYRLTGAVGVN